LSKAQKRVPHNIIVSGITCKREKAFLEGEKQLNADSNAKIEFVIWEVAKLLKQSETCEESKEKIKKIKALLHN